MIKRVAAVLAMSACGGATSDRATTVVSPAETAATASRVTVTVTGFRSDNGQALVALFSSADGFPDDGKRALTRVALPIEGGAVRHSFEDIEPGEYAVAVLHDESSNFKMDTNALGMPKEGYGASNNARRRFGPPRFEDARFQLTRGSSAQLDIALIYP